MKPIPQVNVVVRGEKFGASTDSGGVFRIELPRGKEYLLVFSHIAYRKVTRRVSLDEVKEVDFTIYLSPEPVKLQEVLVTARKQFAYSRAAEQRALFHMDGIEFERLGEEDAEKAMMYLLPSIVKPLEVRMSRAAEDFTLYVNGEWKESIFLSEADPFRIVRVLVWEAPGVLDPIDLFPLGLLLHRGRRHVVLIETK
jgi:hypothetical protein